MPTQIYYSDTYHPDDYRSEAQASYSHGNDSDSYGYCPIYRDTIYSSFNKVDGNRDVSTMSFTGIVITDDAMIAFGDSRSTRIDAFSNMMRDASVQVKKVFRYDENTLLAVSGLNVVMEKGSLIRLETIISKCIEEENTNVYKAMERISLAMSGINGNCYIYIGRKEADGNSTIQEATVNSEGIFLKPRKDRDKLHITILMNKIHIFSQHLNDVLMRYETKHDEYKKDDIMRIIEDCIRADIKRVEKEYDYCPVGLPVQFEVIEL